MGTGLRCTSMERSRSVRSVAATISSGRPGLGAAVDGAPVAQALRRAKHMAMRGRDRMGLPGLPGLRTCAASRYSGRELSAYLAMDEERFRRGAQPIDLHLAHSGAVEERAETRR